MMMMMMMNIMNMKHIMTMMNNYKSADPGRRAQSSYSYVESKICF